MLQNYNTIIAPVVTIAWAMEFARFTLLELSVSLNGSDTVYYSWPYNDSFQEGAGAPVFTVPFEPLRQQLTVRN